MHQPYIVVCTCLYSSFFSYVLSPWHRYVWLHSFTPNHLHTMRHSHLWIVGKCITICLYFSFCSYIFTKNTYFLLQLHKCTSSYFACEERRKSSYYRICLCLYSLQFLMFQKSTSDQHIFVCSIVESHL